MNNYNPKQIKSAFTLGAIISVLIILMAVFVLLGSIKQQEYPSRSVFFLTTLMVIFVLSIRFSLLISIDLYETSYNEAFGKKARKKFGYILIGITSGLLLLLFIYGWLTNDGVNDIIYDFLLGILLAGGVGSIIGQALSYRSRPDPKI